MRIYLMMAALLISSPTLAEMYKWKDETGKVHYSDQPPPKSAQATQVRPQSNAVPSISSPPKSIAEKEADLRKTQQSKKELEEKQAAEKAQAEIAQKNCNAAQQNLRNLKSGGRISEVNEKGERQILADQQKAERISEAEAAVARYCKE